MRLGVAGGLPSPRLSRDLGSGSSPRSHTSRGTWEGVKRLGGERAEARQVGASHPNDPGSLPSRPNWFVPTRVRVTPAGSLVTSRSPAVDPNVHPPPTPISSGLSPVPETGTGWVSSSSGVRFRRGGGPPSRPVTRQGRRGGLDPSPPSRQRWLPPAGQRHGGGGTRTLDPVGAGTTGGIINCSTGPAGAPALRAYGPESKGQAWGS